MRKFFYSSLLIISTVVVGAQAAFASSSICYLSKRLDFRYKVLELDTSLYILSLVAESSAVNATRELKLYNGSDRASETENQKYSKRIHGQVYFAIGQGGALQARCNAGNSISRESHRTIFGYINPFPFQTYVGGMSFAREKGLELLVERSKNSQNRPLRTLAIAIKAIQDGKSERDIGIETARAAWNEMQPILKKVGKKVREVPCRMLQEYNKENVLNMLKEPLGDERYLQAIPEIREFYESSLKAME